jgi:hypothetical protein
MNEKLLRDKIAELESHRALLELENQNLRAILTRTIEELNSLATENESDPNPEILLREMLGDGRRLRHSARPPRLR